MTIFRVLVAGTSISTFGSYLNMVALNVFVYQATGSALQTGVFMALRLGSGFVAGMLGGTVAARLPRRPVMVCGDLTQAAVLVAFAAAGGRAQIDLLPIVAVVTGLLGTTSSVLLRSSVPDLVGDQQRQAANGLLVTGRAVAMALGFAAGGVLVGWLGYQAAFLVDAVTFVVSATLLTILPLSFPARRRRASSAAGDASPRPGPRGWSRRQAIMALVAAPMILVILIVRSVDALGSASHNVGLPVYATQIQPDDPAAFVGHFFAVWAVGLFAAHQLVKRVRRRDGGLDDPGRSERGFIVGTCVMSATFIVAFAGIPQPWVLAVALIAGAADGFTEITYTTRLQAEPDPQRGYFFGLTAMAENGGLGLGMLLAAALLEVWRPLYVAGVLHGGVIVLAVVVAAVVALRRRAGLRADDATPLLAATESPQQAGSIAAAESPQQAGSIAATGPQQTRS
ncbi:MFS transporter [Micromonospora sp. CPCC 206060]|uniref:MFS transporter n=1 Tax=Micromonospora sp. CPCC 206060 TaxID=3122406 RepID=UPI002FF1C4A4